MTHAELIERLREQRREWLDVSALVGRDAGTVRVRLVRPAEAEMPRLRGVVVAEAAAEWVDAWEGFTEAVLLGDDVGGVTPVTFSAELWREFVRDRAKVAKAVFERLVGLVEAHLQAREVASGN